MKGAIIINPYLIPKESVDQAERLKAEFEGFGVKTDIITDGFIRSAIKDNKVATEFCGYDFAVYLDKDKYLSVQLEKAGIRLFNSHAAIRVCDDKGETYLALIGSELNIPDTIFGALCYGEKTEISKSALDTIADKLGFPIVVKESYGSRGNGVYLARTMEELVSVSEKVKLKPHLYQKYLGYKKGVDIRVMVIGGEAVSAMERVNESDFRSNVALGGKGERFKLTPEIKSAAETAAKTLGLDYCGVDVIFGENDKPYICEVNSNAFFAETEKVTGVNVAKKYAEYILKTLNK